MKQESVFETIKVKGKICLLGDCAVGKTSLIRRFVYEKFDSRYVTTIGAKITQKSMFMPVPERDKRVELTLMIWDIMGRDACNLSTTLLTYQHFVPPTNYFRNAKGAVIVCDITRENSFENMRKWVMYLFKITGKIPVMFTGNKIDLDKKTDFDYSQIPKFAESFNGESILTSAKTGENVEDMFKIIGERIVNNAVDWDAEA